MHIAKQFLQMWEALWHTTLDRKNIYILISISEDALV